MSGRGLSLLAEAYQDSGDDEDEGLEPGGEKDGGRRVIVNKEGVGWFQRRCQDPDPEEEEEEQQTQVKLGGDSYSFVVEQAVVGGSNNNSGGKEICVVEAPEPDTEIEIYFVVEQEESVQDGEEGRVMGGVVGYLKGKYPENGGVQGGGDDGSVDGVEQLEEGSGQSQMFFGGRAVQIQELLEVGDIVSISGGVQEPSESEEEEMFSEAEMERAREEIQRQIQREEERKARNKKGPAVLPVPIDENSGMRKARETDGGEEVEKQAVEQSQADPGQLPRGEEQQEMENGVAETETFGRDGAGADTPDVALTFPRVDGHLQPPASKETASACSESLRSEVPEVTTGMPEEAASSSSTHASVIISATKVRSSRRIAKKRMQKNKKKMTQELPSPSSNLDVPIPNQVTFSGGGGEQQPENGFKVSANDNVELVAGEENHQACGSASATQQSVEESGNGEEEGTRSIQDHIEGEPPLSTGLTEAQQGSQLADGDEGEGFEGGQQQSLEPLTENVSEPISSASASVHAKSTEANGAPPRATAPAELRMSRRLAQKRLKKMESKSKSSNLVPVPIDNQHQVFSNQQSQPPHSQSTDIESRPPPQSPEVPTESNLMIMSDSAPPASTATSAGSSYHGQSSQQAVVGSSSDDVVLDLTATLNQQERTEGRSGTVIRRTPSRFLKSRKSSATATERRLGLSLLTSDGRKANCCFFNFRRNNSNILFEIHRNGGEEEEGPPSKVIKKDDAVLGAGIRTKNGNQSEAEGTIAKIEIPKVHPPPRPYAQHVCEPTCCSYRYDSDETKYRSVSPLAVPFHLGWSREVISKDQVYYRTPCGVNCGSYRDIHRYVFQTGGNIPLNFFSLEPDIHCLNEFQPSRVLASLEDISSGKEYAFISCVNSLKSELPPKLDYISERILGDGVEISEDDDGFLLCCDCEDDCQDKEKCLCWQQTFSGIAFKIAEKEGFKLEGYENRRLKTHVSSGIYECNRKCKCRSTTCFNRVVQNKVQWPLQLFKTEVKGWGVRTLHDMPQGTFICSYAGRILTDDGANEIGTEAGDEYLAELNFIEVNEMDKEGYESDATDIEMEEPGTRSNARLLGKQKGTKSTSSHGLHISRKSDSKKVTPPPGNQSPTPEDTAKSDKVSVIAPRLNFRDLFGTDEAVYIVDAKSTGNIGRYLNHSCSPNAFVQNVFVETHDPRFPLAAFFTKTDVKAGTELTWDYKYEIGSVEGKTLYCYCLQKGCRGKLL